MDENIIKTDKLYGLKKHGDEEFDFICPQCKSKDIEVTPLNEPFTREIFD